MMPGRMVSSGLLRRVALVRTDVSEEPDGSFIRVTKTGELGTTQAATSNRRTLRRNTIRPHGVTNQKTPFFIVTAVKTSNLIMMPDTPVLNSQTIRELVTTVYASSEYVSACSFRDSILSLSSGGTTQLGPIDRAGPCLRTKRPMVDVQTYSNYCSSE
jgi:hypothetical protein